MGVLVLSALSGSAVTRAAGCGAGDPDNAAPAVQATEETLAITLLPVPGPHPLRTTSRLTLPAGAVWEATPRDGSILLVLESGAVCASLSDGLARIARPPQPLPGSRELETIGPGAGTMLWADDRLVVHNAGTLSVRNVDDRPATATITRVAAPPRPGLTEGVSRESSGVRRQ
jgi:hypothetical protein